MEQKSKEQELVQLREEWRHLVVYQEVSTSHLDALDHVRGLHYDLHLLRQHLHFLEPFLEERLILENAEDLRKNWLSLNETERHCEFVQ